MTPSICTSSWQIARAVKFDIHVLCFAAECLKYRQNATNTKQLARNRVSVKVDDQAVSERDKVCTCVLAFALCVSWSLSSKQCHAKNKNKSDLLLFCSGKPVWPFLRLLSSHCFKTEPEPWKKEIKNKRKRRKIVTHSKHKQKKEEVQGGRPKKIVIIKVWVKRRSKRRQRRTSSDRNWQTISEKATRKQKRRQMRRTRAGGNP